MKRRFFISLVFAAATLPPWVAVSTNFGAINNPSIVNPSIVEVAPPTSENRPLTATYRRIYHLAHLLGVDFATRSCGLLKRSFDLTNKKQ
jgi:hypothetical protein